MHLLEKHHIDIACSTQETAKLLQDEIGDVFKHNLYSKLDALLNRYDVPDGVWKIDKLQVSIPNLTLSNWKNDVVNSTLTQVEAFLKSNQPKHSQPKNDHPNYQVLSKEKAYQHLLLEYLTQGKLPPNAITTDLNQIFNTVTIDDSFLNLLFEKIKDDFELLKTFALRMILNLPDELITDFSSTLGISKDLNELELLLKKQPKPSRQFVIYLFWIAHVKRKYSNLNSIDAAKNTLKVAQSYFNLSKEEVLRLAKFWKLEEQQKRFGALSAEFDQLIKLAFTTETTVNNENKTTSQDEIDAILDALQGNNSGKQKSTQTYVYVENAGLVILNPFIVPLFKKLNYLNGNEWKQDSFRHRAVLLLHYLVYGETKTYETELLLNKLLCGINFSDTVKTDWEITNAEKEQCQELLESVISHWAILKNTSVKTLQESFLQRNAKLIEHEKNKYDIIVEKQSIDVLLDHLPWGIGMVKTPWMDNYLTCQWA